jgi:hypothetical protein
MLSVSLSGSISLARELMQSGITTRQVPLAGLDLDEAAVKSDMKLLCGSTPQDPNCDEDDGQRPEHINATRESKGKKGTQGHEGIWSTGGLAR